MRLSVCYTLRLRDFECQENARRANTHCRHCYLLHRHDCCRGRREKGCLQQATRHVHTNLEGKLPGVANSSDDQLPYHANHAPAGKSHALYILIVLTSCLSLSSRLLVLHGLRTSPFRTLLAMFPRHGRLHNLRIYDCCNKHLSAKESWATRRIVIIRIKHRK